MAEAIIAKAKAVYGTRLTKDDYNNLLHKNGVAGVVAYLKDTERYGGLFANVNETQIHRGQVEQLLSKHNFELYIRFCKFTAEGKSSFSYYYIKEQEMKQIILALMYIKAKSNDGYLIAMPAYMMEHVCFDMMKLASAHSFGELLEVLADTPYYKVLKPFMKLPDDKRDIEECALALRLWFVKWALNAIDEEYEGDTAKELKNIFLRRIDLSNLVTCYRRKKFFGEDKDRIMKTLYSYYYRAKPEMIAEMLSRPDADKQILDFLRKVYFKGKIEYDPDYLEVAVEKYNYKYYKNQLSFTQDGMMALYSLNILNEAERSNLQKIIEGARYGRAPADTEKLLVM